MKQLPIENKLEYKMEIANKWTDSYMSSYEIVMIVIASVTLVLALIEATKGNRK